MYYPAFIVPVVEGGYAVMFPDIPEALSQGDTLDESLCMASDALSTCLEEYARTGKAMPDPTHPDQLAEKLAEILKEDGIDSGRHPLIQMIEAPDMDMRPVKLNISMTRGALAAIDKKAERLGMTRSGFLVKAAMAYAG